MQNPSTRVSFLLLGALVSVITGCGGSSSSKSKQVDLSLEPDEPIVISADTSKAKANWFQFSMKVNNKTDAALHILAVTVELGSSLSSQSFKAAFASTDYDYTLDSLSCTYGEFKTIAGGTEDYLRIDSGIAGCNSGVANFIVSGAPNIGDNNFRYSGKATPQGWFVNTDGTLDRFTRFELFFTR